MRVLLVIFGLVTFGVLLGVTVAEMALAVANVAPVEELRYLPAWADAQNELYGWFHYPNSKFTYNTKYVNFDTRVKINSKGLREREYEYQKPPGVYRVLILGDSFTVSLEAPFERVWHELLERKLNDGAADGRRVEVIAAGVQGWSVDQELLYYRHEGYKYNPDLVLLQTFQNDILEADTDLDRLIGGLRQGKPYFILAGDRLELRSFPYRGEGIWLDSKPDPSWAGQARKFLRRNSRVYRLTRTVLAPKRPSSFGCWKSEAVPLVLMVYAPKYPPELAAAWKLYSRLVAELRSEVVGRGQRFAIVNFPDRRQVLPEAWRQTLECWPQAAELSWDLDKPGKLLSGLLRQEGADFLDVTGPFRGLFSKTGKPLYFEKDWHFNPEGHTRVADLLYDWLRARNLVPR